MGHIDRSSHVGARYYAPWLARWTAADPAGMVDGPNLYAYVRGNPVRLVDPDGRESGDFPNSNENYEVFPFERLAFYPLDVPIRREELARVTLERQEEVAVTQEGSPGRYSPAQDRLFIRQDSLSDRAVFLHEEGHQIIWAERLQERSETSREEAVHNFYVKKAELSLEDWFWYFFIDELMVERYARAGNFQYLMPYGLVEDDYDFERDLSTSLRRFINEKGHQYVDILVENYVQVREFEGTPLSANEIIRAKREIRSQLREFRDNIPERLDLTEPFEREEYEAWRP